MVNCPGEPATGDHTSMVKVAVLTTAVGELLVVVVASHVVGSLLEHRVSTRCSLDAMSCDAASPALMRLPYWSRATT